jgi:DNA-directed RNA polymerase specialized sigma24 family protein
VTGEQDGFGDGFEEGPDDEYAEPYEDDFADDIADDLADEAELGQLVRPYTLTRGRTSHAAAQVFDLVTQISAASRDPSGAEEEAQDPEHEAILELVRIRTLSVAELAADLDLPLGVVRILLGDLFEAELIEVIRPVPVAQLPDAEILREVIRGLRAL